MDGSPHGAHAQETLRAEVARLRERVSELEQEKAEMTDNFRITTSVLLERIKALEQDKLELAQRPGTALVLERLEERAPTGHAPEVLTLDPIAEAPESPTTSMCGNCGKRVPSANLASHTVHCYRHVQKCDHCGELVPRNEHDAHIQQWTDPVALRAAAERGDEETLSKMLDHGACPDVGGESVLHIGARNNALAFIRVLVACDESLEPVGPSGETPLHTAAERGHLVFVRHLVELGVSLDPAAQDGSTPLHYAARAGQTRVALYLAEQRADVNAGNGLGSTPLELAQRGGHHEIVLALCTAGAALRPCEARRPKSRSRPSTSTTACESQGSGEPDRGLSPP